ncbi:MAG TPA: methyltransferase domain-containing protein [Terriglobales bacterium]|jgi:trans-aconitate 2-methyltransferase|nr:methyltransferase domain-containing protein [Terriglobales bacterium]
MSTPTQTREWNATDYHRVSGPQVSWGEKVLARVRLRGDEMIMDAGCGTGRLTAELLQSLPRGRVVGVDLSQNMLAGARDYLTSFGGTILLVAADLQDLPFERVFDGIFSTAAFHWVLDHDRLFRSLFRALRPGGWLLAQCGGGPNLASLRKRTNELAATAKYARYFVGFREPWTFNNAETAATILRRAGFAEVETSLEPAVTVLEDLPKYSEFVRTVILRQHLDRVPDAGLRTEFVAALARQAATDNPPFSLDYWRLNLNAKIPE